MEIFFISFLILVLFFVLIYRKNTRLLWISLTAIGTCGAVITAIYLPIYQKWAYRPKLEMLMPEYSDNFIRWGNEYKGDKRFYTLDIEIRNMGTAVAQDCQPFLTAVHKKQNNKWGKIKNWAPIGLKWLLTRRQQENDPYPEMRDLAPERSYIFKVGSIWEYIPDSFIIERHLIPTGQPDKFPPGEYCFEIKVSATNTAAVTKYFKINWEGGFSKEEIEKFRDATEFKKKISVEILNNVPWIGQKCDKMKISRSFKGPNLIYLVKKNVKGILIVLGFYFVFIGTWRLANSTTDSVGKVYFNKATEDNYNPIYDLFKLHEIIKWLFKTIRSFGKPGFVTGAVILNKRFNWGLLWLLLGIIFQFIAVAM